MSRQDDLAQEIRALSEAEAVRALAVLVEDRGLLASAAGMPVTDDELRAALGAAGVVGSLSAPEGSSVGAGEVARDALQYAAAHGDLAGVVGEAVEYARSPLDRFDPVAVSVGVLVVTLLQTEVMVKRDPRGRWSLTVHKRALGDSSLGRLLATLLSHLTNGK
ncbi:hypothetical protein AB0L85_19355 [Streptomyces sp. NPDC052051]|uniref:hypothetical protein n=1 Tax=Streptomyces sp. NPDC052051 TaxID=3154649 RepID=UPI003435D388